jgi:hypothetical protein
LHAELSKSRELKDAGCDVKSHCGGFAFRVGLPKNSRGVDEISCSIPADANMGVSEQKVISLNTVTLETAIIGESGKLMYEADLGYGDGTDRWFSVSDLIQEILRIARLLKK